MKATVPGIDVTVAFSVRPGVVEEVGVRLVAGATVADAIAASGLAQRHPDTDFAALPTGVWGVRCAPGDRLRGRDRVELYRPLQVDPKEARRRRQAARAGATPVPTASSTAAGTAEALD